MLDYSEIIETQGVRVPFDARIITPKIERPLRNGRYKAGECKMLRKILRTGDMVLELGAGLGLCSTIAALNPDIKGVVAIEANPGLVPLIRETHRLNGVESRVDLRNAVITRQADGTVPFYIRADFWASSMEGSSRAYTHTTDLPAIALSDLLAEVVPTVIICDIEGGEYELFNGLDLSGVRNIVLELHPKVYGLEGEASIVGVLAAQGLHLVASNKRGTSVQLFERVDTTAAHPDKGLMPARSYQTWPIAKPRVMIATCMKDEAPFILEWLAWHRAVGVTDFVIFTNDCSDGSDRLLDHLAQNGQVVHLPNPALASGSSLFQPHALTYMHYLPAFREADFFISMDVDEFINIKPGEGRLTDLFAATGPFDALSMSELNHGCNMQLDFEPGWIRSQFPRHQTEAPGFLRAKRGVKTITRLSPRVHRIRNHRPDFTEASVSPLWLDGSGRLFDLLHSEPESNGIDVRGTYDLVTLEHYPLRSLGSYFMKMLRGDVVVAKKSVSQRYWRQRNGNSDLTSLYRPELEMAALAYHKAHFENDAALMAIHHESCAFHQKRIAEALTTKAIQERRDWIMENAWAPRVEI